MSSTIIGETRQGQKATASLGIDPRATCRLDYIKDGTPGAAVFKNFSMAQTAAIRALFSDEGFSYLHVSQAHKNSSSAEVFDGHGHWIQSLRQLNAA